MKRKRLVFITGNDCNQISIIEWRISGNLNLETFDPVNEFNKAAKHHGRWDDFLDQPSENLIYVFYPDGNPGLLTFTTEFDDVPGEPYRLSHVTERQTLTNGMMPINR